MEIQTMSTSEKFCLKWNDFTDNITTTFGFLREDNEFADVTLACEDGQQVEAHKVILAASSPFFQNLLRNNRHPHPLIYMRGIKSNDLLAILDFLYNGEANIFEDNLDEFLAIAEELKLKGLTGANNFTNTGDPIYEPSNKNEKQSKIKENNDKKIVSPNQCKQDLSPEEIKQEGSLAIVKENISGELQELDEKIKTMFAKSKHDGNRIYICKVCQKESKYNNNMRDHIEANHIQGTSLPCAICEKIFRSDANLKMHIQCHLINPFYSGPGML